MLRERAHLCRVGAGSGLTPPLLSHLIGSYGWRAAFWFSAAVGSAAAVVWWLLARDSPQQHPAVSPQELDTIRNGLPGASSAGKIAWRAIFTSKDLVLLVISYFSFGYIAWVFFSWFFLYMTQVRGLDLNSSARYTMLPFLCMTVFCLAGGFLSDLLVRTRSLRAGRCYLASLALFLTAACLVYGSQVHSPQLAAIVLAGGAGVLYLSQSSFWSASADIAGGNSSVFFLIRKYRRPARWGIDCLAHPMDWQTLWLGILVRDRRGARRCRRYLLACRRPGKIPELLTAPIMDCECRGAIAAPALASVTKGLRISFCFASKAW